MREGSMFDSHSYSQPQAPQPLQAQQQLQQQPAQLSFSSPVLSASASPYIAAKSAALSSASVSAPPSTDGALTLGSKIRVRATEGLHPKLAPYAGQLAEIIELPSHPNTWIGIRLSDGRQVKLRKTAFDVESIAPAPTMAPAHQTQTQHQLQQQQASQQQQQMQLAQQQQAQAQAQQQYNLHAYPHNPFSHYHQQPPQQQQQQYAPPLPHHLQPPSQQYAYSSPSPIASPTLSPALSAITAPTQASSSSYTLPMSQLRLDPDLSFDQPASAVKRVTASATPVLSQTNSPVLTGQRTPKQQHTPRQHRRDAEEDEAMSGTESAGSGTDDDALRRSRGASLTDDPEPGMVFDSASKRQSAPPSARATAAAAAAEDDDEDSEASGDDAADYSDDDDEDDDGGAPRKSGSSKSGAKTSASSSKQARSRRGRGRALLGLNVVVVNGRYKGESGFVTKGANGYYSVQFHRPMPELRNLDNTAMKRSSELAPVNTQGKRLALPLAPAQRKVMKAEAAAATGATVARFTKSDSAPASASVSQSVSPTTSHKRKSTFAAPSRKTAVYRRADVKRPQPLQQRGGGNDAHSDCSSCRSDSGSLDDGSASDGQEAAVPRSRGRAKTQAHNWHAHRRSHSNSSVSSSSSSADALQLQGSPRTELLLSPGSFPPSPLTSSPSRPFALQMALPSMSLGPVAVGGGSGSKSASMRSRSPGIKKAASILVALSHQGEVAESPTPPPLRPPQAQQQQQQQQLQQQLHAQQLHAQQLHAQQLQLQAQQHQLQQQQQALSYSHPMQHKPFAGPVAPGQFQLTHMPSSPQAHMMYAVAPQHPQHQHQHHQTEGTPWRPA